MSAHRAHTLRVLAGPAIPLLALACLAALRIADVSITGRPIRDAGYIVGAANVAFYIWARTALSCRWTTQLAAIAGFVAVELIVCSMVRIDGYSGSGQPILTWRGTPKPDERLLAHERAATGATRVAAFLPARPSDWPSFRGADRSGMVRGPAIATDWAQRPPRLLWRHPVGAGWSSFAVSGAYCVTQEQRGEDETVVCYELRTGEQTWVHADRVQFDEVTSGKGPRATPTIDDGRVYALGATGLLNCLDGHSGACLWSVDILADNGAQNALFGMSGSPLVAGDLVIVSPGGKGRSLVAYDKRTGRRVWGRGDAAASYSSPQGAHFGDMGQILNFNAEGLYGHDPLTGAVLWSYPWVSNPAERNNVCQPVALPGKLPGEAGRVFLSSGYGMGCALLAVGRRGEGWHVEPLWSTRSLSAKFTSVVVRDGYAYGLDGTILTCVDLADGSRRWRAGRYGHGQLILVHDLLLIQAESGEVALVEAAPDGYRERGRFPALDERTWNHPVLCGNLLLVRNDREAACFEVDLRP